MARQYKRDANGRFASGGSSSSGGKAKAVKPPTRGRNRLTRDNAGRITSVGGQGATARGGRLKTAAGNKRGAVVARMSLQRGGVVGKPKGLKPGALKGRVVGGGRTSLQPKNTGPGGKKRWLSNDQVIQANEARFKGVRETAQILRFKLPKKSRDYYGVTTVGGLLAKYQGKAVDFGSKVRLGDAIESVTGIRRNPLHGVRETIDNQRKTVRIDLSPIARRQAAIGEKVGNRKPRRRRR